VHEVAELLRGTSNELPFVKAKRAKAAKQSPPLSPRKRRVFYAITIAFPFILLALLEGLLRLIGYGPDLSLFTAETIRGQEYHIMNPDVRKRYFARVPFSPSTSPSFFLVPKPEGTYRIFCLGGSTTVGYPYWYNGSFSTYLQDRLRRLFPERAVEVINVGMTATNSFTVLDMARDLVDYEPDLYIVYDGHNEFYGALGVASHESFNTPRWMTHLYLRAIHLRTVLLLREVATGIAGFFAPDRGTRPLGTMMEKLAHGQFIPYRGSTYQRGLEVFRDNLKELCSLSADHGIPVILGSQVSNLRDQPPFISGDPEPAQRVQVHESINTGLNHWMNGSADSALQSFRASLTHDSLRAETHYLIARCLDSLGKEAEADEEYVKARDYDQLRFRTSTDFNDAIMEFSGHPGVVAVDMEETFRLYSPDSLIGSALMFEHLHPRAFGYFLLARAYADAMKKGGHFASTDEWATADTIEDSDLWETRSLAELDERTAARRTEILLSGWPFKEQFPIVDAPDRGDTLAMLVERLTKAEIGWLEAHETAASHYLSRGDLENAAQEYRIIINQLPLLDVKPYLRLARIYLDQRKLEEVGEVLDASLTIEPTILAYRALGDIALNSGRPGEAAALYEKTFTFPQSPAEQVENGHLLAVAYAESGQHEKARAQTMRVLNLKPDHLPAVKLLQRLSQGGRP
jgi:tetratricopeptide (TPR) repeat protein